MSLISVNNLTSGYDGNFKRIKYVKHRYRNLI